jgi:class 3 adenylate cyclase
MGGSQNGNILVVDDTLASARLLADLLVAEGYSVRTASDGSAALAEVERVAPDLILLDLLMPGMDGIEVCGRLKSDSRFTMIPVVLVTSAEERALRVKALREGADDFLSKPVERQELLARVRSLLRIKRLFDTVQAQASELADWSALLEQRVREEFEKVQRLSLLKRFFSPRLAEALLARGDSVLASHRQEIVVVYIDLRGYTAFADSSQPEEVMTALREFHAAMGRLVDEYGGTLERFTGDGMLVFFNDPVPTPDAPARGLSLALRMQAEAETLANRWRTRGFELGLGIGVAQGFATLGQIGFEGRIDYAAIGAVTNLAQRLCAMAKSGEVLAARRVVGDLESRFDCSSRGPTTLEGFARPVEIVRINAERIAQAASIPAA